MNSMDSSVKNPWSDLFTLFVLLFVCTLVVQVGAIIIGLLFQVSIADMSKVTIADGKTNYMSYLLLASGSIGTFLLPAYYFQKRSPQFILFPKANFANWKFYVVPILFLLALAPLMNLIGDWNMQMKFPDFLAGLESWMRRQEDSAGRVIAEIVMTAEWNRLLLNVVVIGVLPAICEEFFFRGALQHIFKRIFKNEYLAIWVVGFIFSVIHFQFYGFFPRFILGVIFGYAVVWTRNIWTAIIAHFVNNTTVVLLAFYYERQGKGYDALMEVDTYPIITYLGSFVISALIGVLFYQYIKKRSYMENGWVKVATYSNELTGEMVKLSLEQHGILAVLLNKQDSSLKFGKIELFVQENDETLATEIITSNTSEELNED